MLFQLIGGHDNSICCAEFRNQRQLITASVDGIICIWNLENGNLVQKFHCQGGLMKKGGKEKTMIGALIVLEDKFLIIAVQMNLIIWELDKKGGRKENNKNQ